jgi:hypothetical protein
MNECEALGSNKTLAFPELIGIDPNTTSLAPGMVVISTYFNLPWM